MYFEYGEKETAFLRSKDARLAEVIDRIGHIYREVDTDIFSSVVRSIVGQQISTKAQQTIWKRLTDSCIYVSPEAIGEKTEAELQAFGITFKKAAYIKEFSEKVLKNEFDIGALEQMSDEDAIETLVTLKGIGVWTAEMILLFSMQRPNILSFGDLAILRGMRMVYRHRKIDRKLFEKYRRRLSPYCSTASLYFWAVAGGALPELTDPAPKKM